MDDGSYAHVSLCKVRGDKVDKKVVKWRITLVDKDVQERSLGRRLF